MCVCMYTYIYIHILIYCNQETVRMGFRVVCSSKRHTAGMRSRVPESGKLLGGVWSPQSAELGSGSERRFCTTEDVSGGSLILQPGSCFGSPVAHVAASSPASDSSNGLHEERHRRPPCCALCRRFCSTGNLPCRHQPSRLHRCEGRVWLQQLFGTCGLRHDGRCGAELRGHEEADCPQDGGL